MFQGDSSGQPPIYTCPTSLQPPESWQEFPVELFTYLLACLLTCLLTYLLTYLEWSSKLEFTCALSQNTQSDYTAEQINYQVGIKD